MSEQVNLVNGTSTCALSGSLPADREKSLQVVLAVTNVDESDTADRFNACGDDLAGVVLWPILSKIGVTTKSITAYLVIDLMAGVAYYTGMRPRAEHRGLMDEEVDRNDKL